MTTIFEIHRNSVPSILGPLIYGNGNARQTWNRFSSSSYTPVSRTVLDTLSTLAETWAR